MNLLIISCLAVASLSLLPTKIMGTTTTADDTEHLEEPKVLPLVGATQPAILSGTIPKNYNKDLSEIWQEDDREVLIRNERGAKNIGGSGVVAGAGGAGGAGGSGGGGAGGGGKRAKNKKNKNFNHNNEQGGGGGLTNINNDGSSVSGSQSLSSQNIQDKQQLQHITQLANNQKQAQLSKIMKEHTENMAQQQQHQQQHPKQQLKSQSHQTQHPKHTNKQKTNDDVQVPSSCRYVKSPWTECDAKTNTRSRTLTLKKGEDGCVPTRTIQKKCKKACRYEKGSWSECVTGQMTRTDKMKPTNDPTCQATRVVNKNCNPGKSKDKGNKERKNKDKAGRNNNKGRD